MSEPKLSGPDEQRQRDENRKLQSKVQRDQAHADTEFVMSDARGRRLLAALLVEARIFQTSMASDALTIAFNEGKREQGLRLLARLTAHTPELYLLMEKERVNG